MPEIDVEVDFRRDPGREAPIAQHAPHATRLVLDVLLQFEIHAVDGLLAARLVEDGRDARTELRFVHA